MHIVSIILTPKLLEWIGLYDTCGIHNLHGIPGLIGGISSGIICASYHFGVDHRIEAQYSNHHFLFSTNNGFLKQGAIQVGGTLFSFVMGVTFGIIGGLVTGCFYK